MLGQKSPVPHDELVTSHRPVALAVGQPDVAEVAAVLDPGALDHPRIEAERGEGGMLDETGDVRLLARLLQLVFHSGKLVTADVVVERDAGLAPAAFAPESSTNPSSTFLLILLKFVTPYELVSDLADRVLQTFVKILQTFRKFAHSPIYFLGTLMREEKVFFKSLSTFRYQSRKENMLQKRLRSLKPVINRMFACNLRRYM